MHQRGKEMQGQMVGLASVWNYNHLKTKSSKEKTTFKMHGILIKCLLWTLQTSKFLPRTPNKSLEAWGTLDSSSAPHYSEQEARGWEVLIAMFLGLRNPFSAAALKRPKATVDALLCQQISIKDHKQSCLKAAPAVGSTTPSRVK